MHKLRIARLLQKGEAEWPTNLVPLGARALIAAAGRLAPPFASGLFAECHLAHATRTDLVVRLHPADADAILAASPPPGALAGVLRRWRTPGDRIAFLPAIDLEFDLPGRVVGFFMAPLFEPELMRGLPAIVERDAARLSRGARPLAEDRGPDVLRAVDHDLSPRILERADWCRRMLPHWANFLPAWSCQTRPLGGDAAVRAVVTFPRRYMKGYLESVGWRGDIQALDEVATLFLADKPIVSIDMTIGKEGPARGVGLFWETPVAHPDDASLARLCRRIEGCGWAREDRWNGLMTWLEARDGDDGEAGRRSLTFKLVVAGDAAPVLKAYVANFDELGIFPTGTTVENAVP